MKAHLRTALRRLLKIAGNLLCRCPLLSHGCGDGRCNLRHLADRIADFHRALHLAAVAVASPACVSRPAPLILIPCKSFAAGKSRLSTVLSPERRDRLCRGFLINTVDLAAVLVTKGHIHVVSSDG